MGFYLDQLVLPNDLGLVTSSNGGFRLGPGIVRIPDVAYVAKGCFDKLPRRFQFAPDLAVEIVSEDEDTLRKTIQYLEAGTNVVWAVYPDEREIIVLTLNDARNLHGLRLNIADTLARGDVLPGFSLAIATLFAGL